MAAGKTGAQEGALATSAKHVDNAEKELRTKLSTLRTSVSTLAASWAGSSGETFVRVMQAWDEKADAVVKVLTTFEDNLNQTDRQMQATDQDAQGKLNKLAAILG